MIHHRILNVILTVGCLMVVSPAPSLGNDDARAIDDHAMREIVRHIVSLYSSLPYQSDPRINKWNQPIRYHYGKLLRNEDRAFFERTMRYVGELTGLSVEKIDGPNPDANMYILMTSDFKRQMANASLRAALKMKGESEEEFKDRVAAVDKPGDALRHAGINDDSVAVYYAAVDGRGIPERALHGLFLKEIFLAFTFTDGSDVIQPSVANRALLHRPSRLPSIDEAFLRALYDPEIRNGMPLRQALPLIAAHIYRDLYGSQQ